MTGFVCTTLEPRAQGVRIAWYRVGFESVLRAARLMVWKRWIQFNLCTSTIKVLVQGSRFTG